MPKITLDEALKGLRYNTLSEIDLSGTVFYERGVFELAKALATNITVTSINLSNCIVYGFTPAVWGPPIESRDDSILGKELAKALRSNKILQALKLDNIRITKSDNELIKLILNKNRGCQLNWSRAIFAMKVAETKDILATASITLADSITEFLGEWPKDINKVNLNQFWDSKFFQSHLVREQKIDESKKEKLKMGC